MEWFGEKWPRLTRPPRVSRRSAAPDSPPRFPPHRRRLKAHQAPVEKSHRAPVEKSHRAPVEKSHRAPVEKSHRAPVEKSHRALFGKSHR
ncbi:hypothetical protein GCM10022226_31140 [Sphaerisporangium flaviroseum]|uniref:Uncharacterized protein n=1 Tax=Sphaerisporangium flaviroseum TaxID=509199 RepID=A0ABP7I361_9ACTN